MSRAVSFGFISLCEKENFMDRFMTPNMGETTMETLPIKTNEPAWTPVGGEWFSGSLVAFFTNMDQEEWKWLVREGGGVVLLFLSCLLY